jgi:transcriptional regulator with XRE-family HTH domain
MWSFRRDRFSISVSTQTSNYLRGNDMTDQIGGIPSVTIQTQNLTEILRQVRKACHLSQLELSLRLGVSQRHISFVEGGRAKPSRGLLITWLQELDAPLVLHNEVMILAGYAPIYSSAILEDPALSQVNRALEQLLNAHNPMPAFVIDAEWNLVRLNRGGKWLATTLVPWAVESVSESMTSESLPTPLNLLEILAHPEGFAKSIVNLGEVGPALLAHVRQEAIFQPGLKPRVEAFAKLLRDQLGESIVSMGGARLVTPILTTRYKTKYGELAFFSMFTTFGTPQDITLASLRVEHLFAADTFTDEVIRSQVM